MIVFIDLLRDTGVVGVPFLLGDSAIVVVIREVHQELEDRLIVRDLTRDNLRVDLAVVVRFDINGINRTTARDIHFSKGCVDCCLS